MLSTMKLIIRAFWWNLFSCEPCILLIHTRRRISYRMFVTCYYTWWGCCCCFCCYRMILVQAVASPSNAFCKFLKCVKGSIQSSISSALIECTVWCWSTGHQTSNVPGGVLVLWLMSVFTSRLGTFDERLARGVRMRFIFIFYYLSWTYEIRVKIEGGCSLQSDTRPLWLTWPPRCFVRRLLKCNDYICFVSVMMPADTIVQFLSVVA